MTKSTFKVRLATAAAALMLSASAHAGEVNWWVSEPGRAKAQQLAAEFEKENPGITIKLQANPYGGLEGKVMIAVKSGIPPDIIEVQNSWIPSYQATGALEDVGATIGQSVPLSDFVPATLAACSVDGKIYGLPFQAEALAMLYRKDLFREAKLDPEKPPQTWDEMIEVSKKLTYTGPNGQRRYGYGIAGGGAEGQGNTLYRSLPYIWMNGGDILSADMKKSVLSSPEAVAGVKFYTDMYTSLKVAPPSTLENGGLELRRLFMAGTIAMYQGTPTELERFAQDAPNLDYGVAIMPHPKGKQTSALLGGWGFIVPKAGKNKAEAMKLLQFLAKPERLALYTRTFPTTTTAMNLPRFADPKLDAFKEMLKHARPQPPIGTWLEISSAYYKNIQEVLIGGASPQAAMAAADKAIEAILKKAN
ncbi:sugar ABC transporter substrate-binding protein [Bosea sp. BK604]|uniref:ABC transporter substrate-binding protein n=1 Tax=Bosea sp. BK604 TaxID=2512180 RepID=UPI0010540604|nr:sugar ABC transporter substrate-binding protein [Bosea sp. BK604]TCR64059.1 carbohydrate ABC transporter substrate-binding protein (CUT1 family) [Bosea sp. BK604]